MSRISHFSEYCLFQIGTWPLDWNLSFCQGFDDDDSDDSIFGNDDDETSSDDDLPAGGVRELTAAMFLKTEK